MFDPVADRSTRRRSLWFGSLLIHASAGALLVGLPYLRAADEELPEPEMKTVVVTFYPGLAGGPRTAPPAGNPRSPSPARPAPSPTPRIPVVQPSAAPDPGPASADTRSEPTGDDGADAGTAGGGGTDPGGDSGPGGGPGFVGLVPGNSSGSDVFESSAPDVILPVIVHRVQPVYPDLLRQARVEGDVELTAIIEVDGSVSSIEVASATNPHLGASAVRALSGWTYRPGRIGNRTVRVRVLVHVRFSLR